MKKIIYTMPGEEVVAVVIPAPKDHLETVLGPLTDEEYEAHVKERSIPEDAVNPRDVEDSDIPNDREFRNAWVDLTAESRIDICCEKAAGIAMEHLRALRNPLLAKLDTDFILALEKNEGIEEVKAQKQALRDITEPLKALKVAGKLNDEQLLNQIRTLKNQLDEG
jgi:hypothetical protein